MMGNPRCQWVRDRLPFWSAMTSAVSIDVGSSGT